MAHTEIEFCGGYNLKIETRAPKQLDAHKANIVFLQNYLSHIGGGEDSFNNFLKWFVDIMVHMNYGSFFVLVDFGYESTIKTFKAIMNKDFLCPIYARVISAHCDDVPFKIHYPMIPYGLYTNVFTDEIELLRRRFVTKYYYVVLKKELIS